MLSILKWIHLQNHGKSYKREAKAKCDFPPFDPVNQSAGLKAFLCLASHSRHQTVERMTPRFHCFLLTFSLGIAQLSKYNCHMLIHFGRVAILWVNSHAGGLWLGRLCRPRLELLAQTSSSIWAVLNVLETKCAVMSLGLHSESGNDSILSSV